jgi:hypothetical protein
MSDLTRKTIATTFMIIGMALAGSASADSFFGITHILKGTGESASNDTDYEGHWSASSHRSGACDALETEW